MRIHEHIAHALRVAHSVIRDATKARSPMWRHVERLHLALQGACVSCGGTRRLQVHHLRPYHLDPPLELDMDNLATACMGPLECHLRIFHGGDFRAYNPNALLDAKLVRLHPDKRGLLELKAKAARLYEDPQA